MSWAIYFDDETVAYSDAVSWEDVPVDGVIFVVQRLGDRVAFHSGADYYVRFDDDGSIAATGELGPLLRRRPPIRGDAIKFGRWSSIARYERICKRAAAEWK